MRLEHKKTLGNYFLIVVLCLIFSGSAFAASYTVKSGDTLWLIANRLGTDIASLQKLNPGISSMLYPGQVITVPSGSTSYTTYTVTWGDTLWKIANRFNTTVSSIRSLNQLSSDTLYPGQKLKLSSSSISYQPSVNKDLLARLVHSEAEAEPYEGQVAVAAVALNRVKNSSFPNTLEGVVYEKSAFEVVSNGRIYQPAGASAQKAAQDALNGWDPSYGSLFFYNPSKIYGWNWILSRPVVRQIGNHVFAC